MNKSSIYRLTCNFGCYINFNNHNFTPENYQFLNVWYFKTNSLILYWFKYFFKFFSCVIKQSDNFLSNIMVRHLSKVYNLSYLLLLTKMVLKEFFWNTINVCVNLDVYVHVCHIFIMYYVTYFTKILTIQLQLYFHIKHLLKFVPFYISSVQIMT